MSVRHSTLVAMGVRWLGRKCSVVFYEFATAADENPDVIGWAPEAGWVLIECKLTHSDFLRDAAKAVRKNPRSGWAVAGWSFISSVCHRSRHISVMFRPAEGEPSRYRSRF